MTVDFLGYDALYSAGVMEVSRLKYLQKKEGLGKFISSDIWLMVFWVCRKSTFMRVTMARSIHSLAVMPLAWRMMVPR